MAEIRIQKIIANNDVSKRKLYARVAYFYQQYTLKDVEKMPQRDVMLLLKTAQQIEANRFLNLTQICAAPHTEKGRGVKKLTAYFKGVLKNG